MEKHLFLSNPFLLEHGNLQHPENANRLTSIFSLIEKSPYKQFLDLSISRLASVSELAFAHDFGYIDYILSMEGKDSHLDEETVLTPGSVKAALMAAGLSLELVEQVWKRKVKNGFALVRPPGHHARSAAGMGYCIFNNIAMAAKKALSMGARRILILDWDVHHGNGTQEIFYDDDQVLFIDIHQENLFPLESGLLIETGKGKGKGFTVNIPLPKGCKDPDYLYTFEKIVRPLALAYRPDLILVSAGFDAHESDPMGGMWLTSGCFGILSAMIKSLADDVCNGKVAFFLEGGYDPFHLSNCVLECIRVLTEDHGTLEKAEREVKPCSIGVELLIKKIYELHVE